MFTMKYYNAEYYIYSREELERMGYKNNPNIPFSHFMHCVPCDDYQHMQAMTRASDTVFVCKKCGNYASGRQLIVFMEKN
jgi:ribosomal protein S27E